MDLQVSLTPHNPAKLSRAPGPCIPLLAPRPGFLGYSHLSTKAALSPSGSRPNSEPWHWTQPCFW